MVYKVNMLGKVYIWPGKFLFSDSQLAISHSKHKTDVGFTRVRVIIGWDEEQWPRGLLLFLCRRKMKLFLNALELGWVSFIKLDRDTKNQHHRDELSCVSDICYLFVWSEEGWFYYLKGQRLMPSHKDNNDKHKQGIHSDILVSYLGIKAKMWENWTQSLK